MVKRILKVAIPVLLIIIFVNHPTVDYLWDRYFAPMGTCYVTLNIGSKGEHVDTKLHAKGTYYTGYLENPKHNKLGIKWDHEKQSNKYTLDRGHGAYTYHITFPAKDINKYLDTLQLTDDLTIIYYIYNGGIGYLRNDIYLDAYILEDQERIEYAILVDNLRPGFQNKFTATFPINETEMLYVETGKVE